LASDKAQNGRVGFLFLGGADFPDKKSCHGNGTIYKFVYFLPGIACMRDATFPGIMRSVFDRFMQRRFSK
jgi:hypothetical protein